MIRYQDQAIAFLTQHGKERPVARILEPALGCRIEHVTGFNTDCFGTFTGDMPRVGSQLDAARRKARMGMDLSGLRIGLASEGSFGHDPATGMFAWNTELLLLVDERHGIEIAAVAQAPAVNAHCLASSWEQLEEFAIGAGFPAHHLVLRPRDGADHRLYKGLAGWDLLRIAYEACRRQANNALVFAESDLRAFANPTRMANIERATRQLAERALSRCPRCRAPGYWIAHQQPGLPCRACGAPTGLARAELWRCPRCAHEAQLPSQYDAADPRHCDRCNP